MTRSLRLSELLCSVEAAATGWGAPTPGRAASRGGPGGRVASTDAARRPAVNGGDPAWPGGQPFKEPGLQGRAAGYPVRFGTSREQGGSLDYFPEGVTPRTGAALPPGGAG